MRNLVTIFIFLIPFTVSAQHDIYSGIQTDLGVIHDPTFSNNVLKKKNYSPHIGGQLFINFRLFDLISLEAGLGQHWNNTRFKDPQFEKDNDGFSVELNSINNYWNYYLAAGASIRLGSGRNYLYGKVTYSYNRYGNKDVSNSTDFAVSRLSIDQTITSSASYVTSNQSIIPEIGIQHKTSDRNLLSAGIRINRSDENAMSGSYIKKDNISGETIVDQFSSLGNFTSITFSYHFLLKHIPKKEREKKIRRIPIKIPQRKDTVLAKVDTVITKIDTVTDPVKKKPTRVANRTLNVSQKMRVHSSKVKVFIWDHQTVDGDRVSLNLNGEWILENFTLEKKKHMFEIDLVEGENTFVLHALNLGKYEPNTAALIVKDNDKSHQIILESDLKESGTLIINYKKDKHE